jgi:hypothetical protein
MIKKINGCFIIIDLVHILNIERLFIQRQIIFVSDFMF